MPERTALLAGGSGLVGGHCLELLLAKPEFGHVISVGRRTLPVDHPRLEQRVIDFDRVQAETADTRPTDVFCCLGTTLSQAGSKAAFRRVDAELPLDLAKVALAAGAERFLLVSAAGASPGSRFFYSRTKGEAESELRGLGFPSLYLFRPSLLLGDRAETRIGEAIAAPFARLLSPLLAGPLSRYRPVQARTVAAAMVAASLADDPGTHIFGHDQMQQLAAGVE